MSMSVHGRCLYTHFHSVPLKRCRLWSYNTTQITLYSTSTVKHSCALVFSKILSRERVLLEGINAFKKKKNSFTYIHYIRWYCKTKPWRPLLVKTLTGVRRSFGWATTQQLGSSRRSFALLFFSSMTTWPLWVNSSNGKSKEPWPACGANPALKKNIFTNPWTLNTI